MKVSELVGTALDWAVAKCERLSQLDERITPEGIRWGGDFFKPSTSWAQGGPIIEREGLDVQQVFCGVEGSFSEPCGWQAKRYKRGGPINPQRFVADTPLIAAMRCYVASKLGDEIELPDELLVKSV